MTLEVGDVIRGLEARGATVSVRRDGALTVRPKGVATPDEIEVLGRLRKEAVGYLFWTAGRTEDLIAGLDWSRAKLHDVNEALLEISVPWSGVRLVIAPGCRIARELRASDLSPGRVWCACEVIDLLLSGVTPEDARAVAEARLALEAEHLGVRKET